MKKRNTSILLSVAFVLFYSLHFCTDLLAQQQIDPKYISISDGLSSPLVNTVIQDSYGLIWVGTANGVQKYDGYRFETFKNIPGKPTSLLHNLVWGLLEDADHNIWVGTSLGISRYDRLKNQFTNYTLSKLVISGGGLSFRFFQDSQKRLWVGTQNLEVLRYDPEKDEFKFAKYEVPNVEQPGHNGISLGITEDRNGNVWIGSSIYGLMRLAKNEDAFKPVAPVGKNEINFKDVENYITSLYADRSNTIWITARNGVYTYNNETGVYKTIREYQESRIDGWNNWNCISQDPSGNIWIANNFRGILKFKPGSDQAEEITISGKLYMRTHGWNITLTNFMIDRSGIFWWGSREYGLLKYDPVNKPFSCFTHDDANPLSISANGVYGILASRVKPGIVYVGTRGGSLNVFDPQKQTFEKVSFKVVDDRFGGSVRSIGEDGDGSLWLGSWGDGLIKLDQNFLEVRRYKNQPQTENSISGNLVRVIKPDGQGKIWVGTDNGLNILDIQTGSFQRIPSQATKIYSKNKLDAIEKLLRTDQNIGMIDQVSDVQNKSQTVEIKTPGKYIVISVAEGDVNGMADVGWIENQAKDTVWSFPHYAETYYAGGSAKNRIMIQTITLKQGTYTLRYTSDDSHSYGKWNEAPPDQTTLYGIALIKPMNETQSQTLQDLTTTDQEEMTIAGSNITDIEVDKKYVWVANAAAGLNKIDLVNHTVKYYKVDLANENSINSNAVLDIFKDSRGQIWLATDAGICKLDPDTEKFTRFDESSGLPTNLTQGILEGDNGEMWISTQNGLSQMVTNDALGKVTFINYNSTDGLGGDTFVSLTQARASDGRFYFGGDHGLTTFSSVTANKVSPALIISNLLISNKSVYEMGEDSPLSTNLLDVKSFSLPYEKNNLSFEFAALHFANPLKNQYAHMLKGYDKDWIYDNRNYATYTNLDPGEYDFIIRASNAYGIWNEEGKSIHFTILAPWWRTWWAYGAYVGIAFFGIFSTDRVMRRTIKQRERERSREKELAQAREIEKAYTHLKATQAQLVQSEKMASLGELTAGIAHEIQNPLNFVNNFSEVNKELIEEMKQEIAAGNLEDAKSIAKTISDNEEKIIFHGKRADGIVKGMLQHSRSSSGVKELVDVNSLSDEYLRLAYHGLRAKDKSFNATMKTEFDEKAGKINAVPQDIGRVILNLITNAFYAVTDKKSKVSGQTAYEPTVSVSTKRMDHTLEIRVRDNGNGIPQNIIDKIFQPFFTTKPLGKGTGLGLSMSYEIVTKGHNGELKVESKENEGTTFIIILPL